MPIEGRLVCFRLRVRGNGWGGEIPISPRLCVFSRVSLRGTAERVQREGLKEIKERSTKEGNEEMDGLAAQKRYGCQCQLDPPKNEKQKDRLAIKEREAKGERGSEDEDKDENDWMSRKRRHRRGQVGPKKETDGPREDKGEQRSPSVTKKLPKGGIHEQTKKKRAH